MQFQKINLDGTPATGGIGELQAASNKKYVSDAVNASRENNGYLIICGEGLDSETPSDRTVNIVAISGQLLFLNLVP